MSAPTPQLGTKNKFRFTGEALDPGAELYYMRARYYDPIQGRFLNTDPFAGIAGDPLTMNKFPYALNRPVTLSDPTGLAAENTSGTQDPFAPMKSVSPALGVRMPSISHESKASQPPRLITLGSSYTVVCAIIRVVPEVLQVPVSSLFSLGFPFDLPNQRGRKCQHFFESRRNLRSHGKLQNVPFWKNSDQGRDSN